MINLLGILSLGFALYSACKIISSIFQSCKDRIGIDKSLVAKLDAAMATLDQLQNLS